MIKGHEPYVVGGNSWVRNGQACKLSVHNSLDLRLCVLKDTNNYYIKWVYHNYKTETLVLAVVSGSLNFVFGTLKFSKISTDMPCAYSFEQMLLLLSRRAKLERLCQRQCSRRYGRVHVASSVLWSLYHKLSQVHTGLANTYSYNTSYSYEL